MPDLRTRLLVLHKEQSGGDNGITEHGRRLAESLRADVGIDAELLLHVDRVGWLSDEAANPSRPRQLKDADVVFLQYNPFSYGRRGFAPWLVGALTRLRLRKDRPRIALMVHEAFVNMSTWQTTLMGLWQRRQLALLSRTADDVFSSTEPFRDMLMAGRYAERVTHLPVGSNLPDMRAQRDLERDRLGVPANGLVLAAFGKDHPSRQTEHLTRAAEAVARVRPDVTVLNLGADAPALGGLPPEVRVHQPGRQPAETVAEQLAAADIFLAPFVDGVSTRRTTVMAGLQHGLAVVGTDGRGTDRCLWQSDSVLLTPADRADLFADAAASLAVDDDRRRALGAAGREIYEKRFDWPVTARLLAERLCL